MNELAEAMIKKTSFAIVLFLATIVHGQIDTLNKFDSRHKKTGYWKVFLNEKADPVKTVGEALFLGFEYWEEGKRVTSFPRHKWRFDTLIYDGTLPSKGQPIAISGTFKWFDRKNRLIADESYLNGNPVLFRSYSGPQADSVFTLLENLDYTKRFNGKPGTFFLEMHSNGGVDKYWFRNGKRGWRCYEIED